MERKLKWTMFSFSADFLMGYVQRYKSKWTETYLNEQGSWELAGPLTNFGGDNYKDHAEVRDHYGKAGIVLGANMDLPIGPHFILATRINFSCTEEFFVKRTGLVDPLGEFTDRPNNYLNFDSSLSIGLRYVFGKKKVKDGE